MNDDWAALRLIRRAPPILMPRVPWLERLTRFCSALSVAPNGTRYLPRTALSER